MFIGSMQQFLADIGPWFLHNKNLGTFLDSVAITYDVELQTLDLGLRLAHPLDCDELALPILSRDRGIPLYPAEPVASKRQRLASWKTLHRTRGTHIGELRTSQPYFQPSVPMMRVVHQSGGVSPVATWHTLGADGVYYRHVANPSNWNWDGNAAAWSRFWVILYAPTAYVSDIRYGDGTRYGDGSIYAGASSSQIAQDLVGLITNWKSAHSALWGYCVATDPASFDPTAAAVTSPDGYTTLPAGNWGQPLTSVGVRTRLPSALWLYDRRSA